MTEKASMTNHAQAVLNKAREMRDKRRQMEAASPYLLAVVKRAIDWHNGDSEDDDWHKIVREMHIAVFKAEGK